MASVNMQVALVTAKRTDRATLENLLELYIHDFSEILGDTPGEAGRFGYAGLDAYWSEAGHLPYLIRADGRLAGFALVCQGSRVSSDPTVFDLAEFFVVRGLRRRGVGLTAAALVLAAHPGVWEVRVMVENVGAQHFWERAIGSFTGGRFETFAWRGRHRRNFRAFRFTSPALST